MSSQQSETSINIIAIIKQQWGPSTPWEINCTWKKEYDKLPLNVYPITIGRRREGVLVMLHCGDRTCEASLHRKPRGSFWVGSARLLLGGEYTDKYKEFFRDLGLNQEGKEVSLTFIGSEVYISTR